MAAARKDRDLAAEVAFLTRALKAPAPREFVGRLAERADRDRVGDRLGHQPLPQVALARPAVQRRDLTGQRQREFVGQQITEQVMVAVPLANSSAGQSWLRSLSRAAGQWPPAPPRPETQGRFPPG